MVEATFYFFFKRDIHSHISVSTHTMASWKELKDTFIKAQQSKKHALTHI